MQKITDITNTEINARIYNLVYFNVHNFTRNNPQIIYILVALKIKNDKILKS